jgi:hypothetical protein
LQQRPLSRVPRQAARTPLGAQTLGMDVETTTSHAN